ncbi:SEC10/PgrA surface exclusion domain-containing protein, partial [Lactobacillus intestinalis]
AQTAQKNENDKKTALDKTQDAQKKAQQLVNDSKDSAKVKQANNDVTNKQTAVKAAQDAQKTADQKVSDQNKVVAKDQTAVDSATKVRDQKQTAKNSADAQVKTAEDALKGTGIAEAEKAYNDAKSKETAISDQLSKDSESKTNLEKQQNEIKAQLPGALKNSQTLTNTWKNYQQQLKDAKNKSDQALTQVNSKQSEIQKLNDQLKELTETSRNKITIPDLDKYKTALLDYAHNEKQANPLTSEDITYMNEARAQNHYISSEEDKKEKVDLNHMTDDQIKDLSLFAAHLTTQLRSQFGWKADVVTNGSINFGKAVAAGYLADNKTRPNWHDDKALTQIVNDQKLNSDGEAMGPDYNGYPATMDDLKKGIYDLMNSMIFTEGNGIDEKGGQSHYELGHAEILLGAIPFIINGKETIKSRDYLYSSDLRDQLDEINYKKEMAKELASQGIQFNWDADLDKVAAQLKKEIEETKQGDISVVVTRYDDNSVDYHFLRCTPESNSPYDLTVIPSYAQQIEDVKNQIQTKNNELNNLQKQEKESSNQENKIQNELLTPAKEKAHAANAKTKDLQNKLNTIGDQINKLDTQISTLNTQLKDSQATVSQNKGKLEILTADNQTKTANLEKAQTAQKQAQSELTDAQAELNNAQKTLDDAKKNLETLQKDAQSKGDAVKQAQTALETAQKHVEDLKNAPQILKNANDAKANAQTEYDAAKKALNEAEAQIKKLENEKSTADGQVATAQATYNEALTRLKSAQDKLAKAKEALNNIQNDQKIISTPDQKPVEKKTTKTVKKTTKSTKKAKKVSSHVRLTHNAFIYTKSGKAIRSGLHFKLVRRGKTVKALKNAKIVTIKGKRFYQIGKNQFIKVANAKIVTHAVHVKAVIKGKKAVRAYDRLGKLNKHSVKGGHTYTFNEKAVINGKTYYKIAWTNNWIPASKLNLKK